MKSRRSLMVVSLILTFLFNGAAIAQQFSLDEERAIEQLGQLVDNQISTEWESRNATQKIELLGIRIYGDDFRELKSLGNQVLLSRFLDALKGYDSIFLHWDLLSDKNNIQQVEAFLDAFPEDYFSGYATRDEAMHHLFLLYDSKRDPDLYRRFLDKYPDAQDALAAQRRLESTMFKIAVANFEKDSTTSPDLYQFIANFPTAPQVKDAVTLAGMGDLQSELKTLKNSKSKDNEKLARTVVISARQVMIDILNMRAEIPDAGVFPHKNAGLLLRDAYRFENLTKVLGSDKLPYNTTKEYNDFLGSEITRKVFEQILKEIKKFRTESRFSQELLIKSIREESELTRRDLGLLRDDLNRIGGILIQSQKDMLGQLNKIQSATEQILVTNKAILDLGEETHKTLGQINKNVASIDSNIDQLVQQGIVANDSMRELRQTATGIVGQLTSVNQSNERIVSTLELIRDSGSAQRPAEANDPAVLPIVNPLDLRSKSIAKLGIEIRAGVVDLRSTLVARTVAKKVDQIFAQGNESKVWWELLSLDLRNGHVSMDLVIRHRHNITAGAQLYSLTQHLRLDWRPGELIDPELDLGRGIRVRFSQILVLFG